MATNATYTYSDQLSRDPSLGIETVAAVNAGTVNLSSAQDTITNSSPLAETINGVDQGVPTYDSYTSPDNGPIVLGADGHTYVLTNTVYQVNDSFTPVSTPNFTACFATGTRILTAQGERPVECLDIGDLVPTLVGRRMAAVRWIGHIRVDCRRHPRPWDVNPIRVSAGAFGEGLPLRDLVLSPDHSVFVDGTLMPVRYLVNEATIRQQAADQVTYWHVELERHDVLFADGLPAESYLDTGNRQAFANAGVTPLHPDLRLGDRAIWARDACAELVENGPALADIRDRLAARAAALGCPVAAEHRIGLAATGRSQHVIPPGVTRVALVSGCLVPNGESRRLGVCIAQLALDGETLPLDAAALASGFHAVERGQGTSWRWTNGEAALQLAPSQRARHLAVDVRMCVPQPAALAA